MDFFVAHHITALSNQRNVFKFECCERCIFAAHSQFIHCGNHCLLNSGCTLLLIHNHAAFRINGNDTKPFSIDPHISADKCTVCMIGRKRNNIAIRGVGNHDISFIRRTWIKANVSFIMVFKRKLVSGHSLNCAMITVDLKISGRRQGYNLANITRAILNCQSISRFIFFIADVPSLVASVVSSMISTISLPASEFLTIQSL